VRLGRRETTDHSTARRPSEAITRFAYDAGAQQLYVTFPEGRTYVYFPLSAQDYARFIAARSRGTHLNSEIKRRCRYQMVPRIPPLLKIHRG
jgi:hypothetical protein